MHFVKYQDIYNEGINYFSVLMAISFMTPLSKGHP